MHKKITTLVLLGILATSFGFAQAATTDPDLIVNSLRVTPVNPGASGKYDIGVTVKNIGTVPSSLDGVLRLVYGTNAAEINACQVGTCNGVGNLYNVGVQMNFLGKTTLAPGESYEIVFTKQNTNLVDTFVPGVEYTFKASVDDENVIVEDNETNNTYSIATVPGSTVVVTPPVVTPPVTPPTPPVTPPVVPAPPVVTPPTTTTETHSTQSSSEQPSKKQTSDKTKTVTKSSSSDSKKTSTETKQTSKTPSKSESKKSSKSSNRG